VQAIAIRRNMAGRKYEKYIIKEDNSPPPPAEMLKRLEEQRKAGNGTAYTRSSGNE